MTNFARRRCRHARTRTTLTAVLKLFTVFIVWLSLLSTAQAGRPNKTPRGQGQTFNFSLSNAGDESVYAGSSVTDTITGSLLSGSTQQISFSVAGLPSGATGSFSQTACNLNCSSILTVGTTGAIPGGTFPITVTATGGGVTKTTTFLLTVLTVTTLTNSSAPAQTWTFCAPENSFCSFSGTMSVAYGANGQFFYQNLTDGTPCSNTVFGDPIPGTAKACYTSSSTATSSTSSTLTTTSTDSSSQSSTSGTGMTAMASSSTSSTANYYVGKNGSDSYSCSQAGNSSTPKLTINAALSCVGTSQGAGANQIVEVAAGTYNESIFSGNFPSGTSWNAPFTLRAHGSQPSGTPGPNGDLVTFMYSGNPNFQIYVPSGAP